MSRKTVYMIFVLPFIVRMRFCAFAEGTVSQRRRVRPISQEWYLPDFVRLQTGGFVGKLTPMVGYRTLLEYGEVALFGSYNILESSERGEQLTTLGVKGTVLIGGYPQTFTQRNQVRPTLGCAVAWTLSDDILGSELPEYMDQGYYPTQQVHYLPFVGVRYIHTQPQAKRIGVIEIYLECNAMGNYLGYAIENKAVHVHDALGLSAGMGFQIKKRMKTTLAMKPAA